MKDKVFVVILFTLSIVITICILKRSFIEPLMDTVDILLLGDYVLGRPSNLGEISIEEEIKNDKKIKGCANVIFHNIKNYTNKCDTISDFETQIINIGKRKNLDKKTTYIFVSIGMNDIVNNYSVCEQQTDNKTDCLGIGEIYPKWEKEIKTLVDTYKKANIVIISGHYFEKGHNVNHCGTKLNPTFRLNNKIDEFNKKLIYYTKNNTNLKFILLNKTLTLEDSIIDEISMNNTSKTKLINYMIKKITCF
jgi:hypothetical protein